MTKPREILEAIVELAMAIKPHNNDRNQRKRIADFRSPTHPALRSQS